MVFNSTRSRYEASARQAQSKRFHPLTSSHPFPPASPLQSSDYPRLPHPPFYSPLTSYASKLAGSDFAPSHLSNLQVHLLICCIPHSLPIELTDALNSMSSGFVPAGAADDLPPEDQAWRKAREDIKDARKRKQESSDPANDVKSLYEVLQQNKGEQAVDSVGLSTR